MEGLNETLSFEIRELRQTHGGLTYIQKRVGGISLSGSLPFVMHPDGLEEIYACFMVELCIPATYPDDLPIARETGRAIKDSYEHAYPSGELCLCVPIKERLIFHEAPNLLGFVNNLVIPFLYGYRYWEKHRVHPFGEQHHGSAGIVQYYVDAFDLQRESEAVEIICFLSKYGYDGHRQCPCGSGLLVKKCHGKRLREFHHHHTEQTLQHDLGAITQYCQAKPQSAPLRTL